MKRKFTLTVTQLQNDSRYNQERSSVWDGHYEEMEGVSEDNSADAKTVLGDWISNNSDLSDVISVEAGYAWQGGWRIGDDVYDLVVEVI